MIDREKVIANVTGIVSDMQEEVDEWKDYSDSELSHGLTCDCDWWYKTLQTLKYALALLKEQEPPTDVSISNAIECLLHPQDADDSDMAKAIDTAVRAMRLVKEQEPVEPIFDYDGNDVWRCGNCHCKIFHPSRTDADENEKNYRRFCFHCGMAVKWDG